MVTREVLWNGNRETLGGAFFSKDLLFLWALQTYPIYRQEYAYAFADPANAHRKLVRLRSRRETAAWLAQLESASRSAGSWVERFNLSQRLPEPERNPTLGL